MKKKLFSLLFLPLFLVSCSSSTNSSTIDDNNSSINITNDNIGEENSPYEEREILTAEAGYDYYLPEFITHYSTNIVLNYESGETLEINSPYIIDKSKVTIGKHYFTYNDLTNESKTTQFHVVDTESPFFQALWTSYSHKEKRNLYIPRGENIDLNDIFRVKDNADNNPTTWFEVYHNEVEKVELTGDKSSIFKAENGYYYVFAHAKDSSNNAILQEQRLDLSSSISSLTTQYGKSDYQVLASGTRGFGLMKISSDNNYSTDKDYKISFDLLNYTDSIADLNVSFSINNQEFISNSSSQIPYLKWNHYDVTTRLVLENTILSNRYVEAKTDSNGFYFLVSGISSGDISLLKNITITEA